MKANRVEEEIIPPGLNLTAQQLFWVGYAQDYCLLGGGYEDSDSFEGVLQYWVNFVWLRFCFADLKIVQGGVHAPAPWRVNVVLSNQRKFAEDFECPAESRMNPTERCIVW